MSQGYFCVSTVHESGLPLCQHSVWVQALVSLCLLSHFSPLKIRMREDAEMQRKGNFPAPSEFPWQHHPAIPIQHSIILQYQHNTVSSCNTNTTQYHPAKPTQHSIILQYLYNTTSFCNINITLHYQHNMTSSCYNNTTLHQPTLSKQHLIKEFQICFMSSSFWYRCISFLSECP